MTLFEASDQIGGQLNIAKQIPGKEEFYQTLRYFRVHLKKHQVKVLLNHELKVDDPSLKQFNQLVVATGITPRIPQIDGIKHHKVVGYREVLMGEKTLGQKVAIIGAGGIGFDVAEFLTHKQSLTLDPIAWSKEWGVDLNYQSRGGLLAAAEIEASPRQVYLLQRKSSKLGKNLGKTSGWTHRLSLKHKQVVMLNGVNYQKIDDQGLHIERDGKTECLAVDHIVLCSGQTPNAGLYEQIVANQPSLKVHLIGGADVAAELDAKLAIRQGAQLAAII